MAKKLAIIGIGAFGEFMLKHVTPYFDTFITDEFRDLSDISRFYNVTACSLEQAAKADFIVIAVPVRAIKEIVIKIKDLVKPGQLIMDVASVKYIPTQILDEYIPQNVDIVGLHPLFGPQSGKISINGHNIALVNVRGERNAEVFKFLSNRLGLNVIECSAEQHDQQMAYVQGLTHMIAKVFQMMDIPEINQETKTFSLLRQMVDTIKSDSDELFKAIQTDNPYVDNTKKLFFNSVKELEKKLHSIK